MPDIVPAETIAARLDVLEAGQAAMNQALGLMIDTLQQQTNLLAEIAKVVREEPGPSPVVQSLDALTEAVTSLGAGIEMLQAKMDELPAAMTSAFDGADLSGVVE